ncbi:hypothetical protein KR059_001448, partial [Drosophila kikkawai]
RVGPTTILFTGRLSNWFRRLIAHLVTWIYDYFCPGPRWYRDVPLSPISNGRLKAVGRKTLVLDLDETLIHSGAVSQAVPDFIVNVNIGGGTAKTIPIRVFKRPHVDFFLGLVSKWYDLVIYTASLEHYADQVVDHLDGGRGMLSHRLYRQHCCPDRHLSKDLKRIGKDMGSIFILDNQPKAYVHFPENALPIKSFLYDPEDTELLKLLPFLDALRFTKDVRSVLGRR